MSSLIPSLAVNGIPNTRFLYYLILLLKSSHQILFPYLLILATLLFSGYDTYYLPTLSKLHLSTILPSFTQSQVLSRYYSFFTLHDFNHCVRYCAAALAGNISFLKIIFYNICWNNNNNRFNSNNTRNTQKVVQGNSFY